MEQKQINPYFVRTVIAVLLILIAVVCTVLMCINRESDKTDIPGTTAMSTTIETTVETTTPPTEQTIPVTIAETEPVATEAIDIPTEPTELKATTPPVTEPKPTEPKPTEPKPTEEEPDTCMSDLEMLACVIYQEAGGNAQCQNCRYRIGDIVLNRVADDRFPNDIHGVLTQKNQYGNFSKTGVKWPSRASNPNEAAAVERAYQVAQDILNGNHGDVYGKGYIWQAGFKQGSEGFWCCGHFYGK